MCTFALRVKKSDDRLNSADICPCGGVQWDVGLTGAAERTHRKGPKSALVSHCKVLAGPGPKAVLWMKKRLSYKRSVTACLTHRVMPTWIRRNRPKQCVLLTK